MSLDGRVAAPDVLPVEVRDVTKRYGSTVVLSSVSLSVEAGERVCIVGPNGSGKSTLLEIVAGLRVPTSGQALVFGRPAHEPSLRKVRGVLPSRVALPWLSKVREMVWLFAGFHDAAVDIDVLLRVYELDGGAYIRHLSKGQLQRLGLLLAFLGNPPLLLLDEPTSGLDPRVAELLWERMEHDLGTSRTLVFTTHDMSEAERRSERVVLMHGGRVRAAGAPARLCEEHVGARSRVVLSGRAAEAALHLSGGLVKKVVRLDRHTVVYTDEPKVLLGELPFDREAQLRIEPVTLKDVFLTLTGDESDVEAENPVASA